MGVLGDSEFARHQSAELAMPTELFLQQHC